MQRDRRAFLWDVRDAVLLKQQALPALIESVQLLLDELGESGSTPA